MSHNQNFYANGFAEGNRRVLGAAISAVENDRADAGAVLAAVYGRTGNAHVIGVTGPPGAGKSTLVGALITEFRRAGQSVAVVAVDPSSPFGGGAILGDRIRMANHSLDDGVFVRSVASRGHLGGLSRTTARVVDLLDGFGFDTVIVETVGSGQAEIDIMHLAQTVILVTAPGLGDAVQAVKAGILEIADIFVVNKADTGAAPKTELNLQEALGRRAENGWRQPILTTVAIDGTGVAELYESIWEHGAQLDPDKRARAATNRAKLQLANAVAELASQRIDQCSAADDLADQVASGRLGLRAAAESALHLISKSPD